MSETAASPRRPCWCGANQLVEFSPEYLACTACGTLVSQVGLDTEQARVRNDEHDYYGKAYWLGHQSEEFGLPEIEGRARHDLPERCLHWLRNLLTYKLPPAKVLELGSAHGAFVALLRWAGYEATGLEVSPWVVELSRRTFDIPVLLGPIEEQPIEPHSLDAIVLNDLLEHLTDPVGTVKRCAELLKPDGVLVIQTPQYVEDRSYERMVAENHRFLEMMTGKVAVEHVYLHSQRSVERLLAGVGFTTVTYERAIFDHYDMFPVASRHALPRFTIQQTANALASSATGRLVQALLDKAREADQLIIELMRTARESAKWHAGLENYARDREALLREIDEMRKEWAVCEADRAARLDMIVRLNGLLATVQADLTKTQERLIETAARVPQFYERMKRAPRKLLRLLRMDRSA